jgi:hypothetical protein
MTATIESKVREFITAATAVEFTPEIAQRLSKVMRWMIDYPQFTRRFVEALRKKYATLTADEHLRLDISLALIDKAAVTKWPEHEAEIRRLFPGSLELADAITSTEGEMH